MALRPPEPDAGDLFGLSLCAGVAGLDLGITIAEPGYRTVGFVERNAFSAAALVARMEDASLHPAPVWDDLATFDGTLWRGAVDVVAAGYPCQPFSTAGKQLGTADPRHLWPHVARIVRDVRPEWLFLENVVGHVDLGFDVVARELAGMGARIEAGLFSAYEVGAPHWRRRLFVLARFAVADADDGDVGEPRRLADRRGRLHLHAQPRAGRAAVRPRRHRPQLDGALAVQPGDRLEAGTAAGELPLFPPAPCDFQDWVECLAGRAGLEPCVPGMADGLAYRVDRSDAAGNGVCPLAAALAWRTLRARHEGG